MLEENPVRLSLPAVLSTLAIALALGAGAMATIPDSSGTIHACYSVAHGVLRPSDSASPCATSNGATTLSFQEFNDGTVLDTEYAQEGVTFGHASDFGVSLPGAVDCGSPTVADDPKSHFGNKVASADLCGGTEFKQSGTVAAFSSPHGQVSVVIGASTDGQQAEIRAYSADGTQVTSAGPVAVNTGVATTLTVSRARFDISYLALQLTGSFNSHTLIDNLSIDTPQERPVDWNVRGAVGRAGPIGAKGPTGQRGVPGPLGRVGPTGPAGPTPRRLIGPGKVTEVGKAGGWQRVDYNDATVSCPQGQRALAGGGIIQKRGGPNNKIEAEISMSYPGETHVNEWHVTGLVLQEDRRGYHDPKTARVWRIFAIAECWEPTAPHPPGGPTKP
ncbi:MAG: collagen-like protein [Solirubrobacteraceae bacterium]